MELNSYIVYGALLIIVLLLFITLIRFRSVEKYFSPLRFKLKNDLQVHPETKITTVQFLIFNPTLHDARVTSFGYVYRQTYLNFFTDYLKKEQLPVHHQPLIAARDALRFELDYKTLIDLILDMNGGKFKVKKLVVYAMTSLGQVSMARTKDVEKQLIKSFKTLAKLEKQRRAGIRKEKRALQREKRLKSWQRFVSRQQQRFTMLKVKLINVFKFKRK
jgi:hypothetical protein